VAARYFTPQKSGAEESRLRFADSGLHSLPRWKVSQAPMRFAHPMSRMGFADFRIRQLLAFLPALSAKLFHLTVLRLTSARRAVSWNLLRVPSTAVCVNKHCEKFAFFTLFTGWFFNYDMETGISARAPGFPSSKISLFAANFRAKTTICALSRLCYHPELCPFAR
jgi:hypothetical protein